MSSNGLPTPITLPAYLWMPPDGFAFDYAAYIALPAVGAGASNVVNFTVPEGYHGVISRVANVIVGAAWTEGSGDLIWQIKANNGVIRNYDKIVASLGAVNNPAQVAGILVYEQQVVDLTVNNIALAVGGAKAGGRLSGWFFPKWRMPDESSIW